MQGQLSKISYEKLNVEHLGGACQCRGKVCEVVSDPRTWMRTFMGENAMRKHEPSLDPWDDLAWGPRGGPAWDPEVSPGCGLGSLPSSQGEPGKNHRF